MRISVVMTTYNGEKYIIKQLESIKNQVRRPDEVIIADDCSTDRTVELIKEYITHECLADSWTIYVNKQNLGFEKNFLSVMQKAKGDVVFLSDQDDIWDEKKIDIMIREFDNNTEINALICRENRIDENDNPITEIKFGTGKTREVSFPEEIRECLGAGHLIALKRIFVEKYIEEIEREALTFDVPFCILAAMEKSFFIIDSFLVERRIHSDNTSGIKNNRLQKTKDKAIYIKGRTTRLNYFKFVNKIWNNQSFNKKEYDMAISILSDSIEGLKNGKLLPLIRELFSTNIYINKKISIANIIVHFRGK